MILAKMFTEWGDTPLKPAELIEYLEKASSHFCSLIGASKAKIAVCDITSKTCNPNAYGFTISFSCREIRMELGAGISPNHLLCSWIDHVKHKLEEADLAFLATTSGGFYAEGRTNPISSEEWATGLHQEIQNELIQQFLAVGIPLYLLDDLSRRPYEGDRCRGKLAFLSNSSRGGATLVSVGISPGASVCLKQDMLRQIRKLLAGTTENSDLSCLLFEQKSDGDYWCIGYCSDEVADKCDWVAHMKNTMQWELFQGKKPLFSFSHGRVGLALDAKSELIDIALDKLKEEFDKTANWNQAKRLLMAAANQKHGTALIFYEQSNPDAANWIEGLCKTKRGIQVEINGSIRPDKVVQSLSRMDGAIIIDVDEMNITAVSTIVDGRAIIDGDLARGARHNSIMTFLSDLATTSKAPIGAAIFSEDGGILTLCGHELCPPVPKKKK